MALSAETVLDADIVLVETVLGVEETEGIVLENVETFLDVDQILDSLPRVARWKRRPSQDFHCCQHCPPDHLTIPDLHYDHSDLETEILTFSNSVYHCNWCSCCQSSLSSSLSLTAAKCSAISLSGPRKLETDCDTWEDELELDVLRSDWYGMVLLFSLSNMISLVSFWRSVS